MPNKANIITEDEQTDGDAEQQLDDGHLFTSAAIAARHDSYVQGGKPDELDYEQKGKIWNDTDSVKDYFWDSENETWVNFTTTTPSGGSGGGDGGASTFLELTDTPSAYTASKFVQVNSDGNALEFVDAPTPSPSGVTKIVAGTNVTISPTSGTGNVTINATGGGGGGDGDTTINYNGAAAWGEVNADGTAAGAGLNFTSERTTDPGVYRITFDNAMGSADYSVQVTALNTLDVTAVAGGKQATSFLVRVFRDGAGLTNSGFTFAVFATNALPPRGGTGSDAWANTSNTGVLEAGFNFQDPVGNPSTGLYDYTFTTPMPTANYGSSGNGKLQLLASERQRNKSNRRRI